MTTSPLQSSCAYVAVAVLAALAWLAERRPVMRSAASRPLPTIPGPDRQKRLEEGARREGTLLLYTTGTQIKPLLDRFLQKYPYLKVELARSSSADTARKVIEEYRAGYEKVDAFELASHGLVVPRDENILQPFQSPELAAYDQDAIEARRHWVVVRESYTGIGFNTTLLPADKAPRTYQALLEPAMERPHGDLWREHDGGELGRHDGDRRGDGFRPQARPAEHPRLQHDRPRARQPDVVRARSCSRRRSTIPMSRRAPARARRSAGSPLDRFR